MKRTALTATVQALAIVKSHYPGVDLQCFEEGYTTDVDEAKLEALSVEVEPTAESLEGTWTWMTCKVIGKHLVASVS